MAKRVGDLEALLYENEANDKEEAAKRESETAARIKDKMEIMAKIEVTNNDVFTTSTKLQKTNIELESTGLQVVNLEQAMVATGEQLSKLSGGLDLTQEYWKGLTRGFRETHRSIAVENEMLPQKGLHTTSLPALVKTAAPQGNAGFLPG